MHLNSPNIYFRDTVSERKGKSEKYTKKERKERKWGETEDEANREEERRERRDKRSREEHWNTVQKVSSNKIQNFIMRLSLVLENFFSNIPIFSKLVKIFLQLFLELLIFVKFSFLK